MTRSQLAQSALGCDILRSMQPKYSPKAFLASPGLKTYYTSAFTQRFQTVNGRKKGFTTKRRRKNRYYYRQTRHSREHVRSLNIPLTYANNKPQLISILHHLGYLSLVLVRIDVHVLLAVAAVQTLLVTLDQRPLVSLVPANEQMKNFINLKKTYTFRNFFMM